MPLTHNKLGDYLFFFFLERFFQCKVIVESTTETVDFDINFVSGKAAFYPEGKDP